MKVDRYVLVTPWSMDKRIHEEILFDSSLERADALELVNHFNKQAGLISSRSGQPLYSYYIGEIT